MAKKQLLKGLFLLFSIAVGGFFSFLGTFPQLWPKISHEILKNKKGHSRVSSYVHDEQPCQVSFSRSKEPERFS